MAAGGGHWIKSPYIYSEGQSAFMPKAVHEEGNQVTLGSFAAFPSEGDPDIWGVKFEGANVGLFASKEQAIGTMTILKATGFKDITDLKQNKYNAKASANKIIGDKGLHDVSPTKIYNSFLDQLLAFSPTASAMVKAKGKLPSEGLFED